MRRGVIASAAAVACAAALSAMFATTSPGAPLQDCTSAQKAKRVAALKTFTRQMAAKRRAFFRTTTNAKSRRAFVQRQNAKRQALARAAACRVPAAPAPVPPTAAPLPAASAGPACAPDLTFSGERAFFHLGPTNYSHYLQATGRLAALVLFVDFPDAPMSAPTAPLVASTVSPAAQWYSEGSYGRLTLAAEPLSNWLRMPKSAVAYDLHYRGDYPGMVARHRAFLADAVAVADPVVDFGRYSTVLIVAAPHPSSSARAGVPFAAGAGVVADGNELRGMVVMSSPLARPPDLVHEAGHLFGLPDIYDFSRPFAEGTGNLGRWDPMSNTGSLAHFLGWVKWKLGWLDASQLRCLGSAGVLDETISPIETAGGVKMVVLPTSGTTAKVVEVHTLRSVSNQVCESGVIVYSVDVQAPSGTASARIVPAREDPATPECGALPRAAFGVGAGKTATYEDGDLRLEVLATDGSSYRVRVTRK